MHSRNSSAFAICILSCLGLVVSKNYLIETKKYTPACTLNMEILKASSVQYKTSLEWTKGQSINNWEMGEWQILSDPHNPILTNRGIVILNGASVQHNTISYHTTVLLPEILKKLINIHLPIKVQKELFVINNQVKVFVKIENVPIISHLYIANVIDISNPISVSSSHFITHGEIPWYATWTINILKTQILQSVDEFDALYFRNACLST